MRPNRRRDRVWRYLARHLAPSTARRVLPDYAVLVDWIHVWLRQPGYGHPSPRALYAAGLRPGTPVWRGMHRAGGVRAAFRLLLPEGLPPDCAPLWYDRVNRPHPTPDDVAAALIAVCSVLGQRLDWAELP